MADILILGSVNWGVIGWVALGTVLLVILVAAIGRGILAAFPPRPEHMSSFKKVRSTARPPAAIPSPSTPAPTPSFKNISPETLASISAAIAVVLRGKKFTLRSVRQEHTNEGTNPSQQATTNSILTGWSQEGLRQVHFSHNLGAIREKF